MPGYKRRYGGRKRQRVYRKYRLRNKFGRGSTRRVPFMRRKSYSRLTRKFGHSGKSAIIDPIHFPARSVLIIRNRIVVPFTTSVGPYSVAQWYVNSAGANYSYTDASSQTVPASTNYGINDLNGFLWGYTWNGAPIFQYLSSLRQFYCYSRVLGVKLKVRFEPTIVSNVATNNLALFVGCWPGDQGTATSIVTSTFYNHIKTMPQFKVRSMKAVVGAQSDYMFPMSASMYMSGKKAAGRMWSHDPRTYSSAIGYGDTSVASPPTMAGYPVIGICTKNGGTFTASTTYGQLIIEAEIYNELTERRVFPND